MGYCIRTGWSIIVQNVLVLLTSRVHCRNVDPSHSAIMHSLWLRSVHSEHTSKQLKTAKQPQRPVNFARLIWARRTGTLRKLQCNSRKTRKLSSQATQQASLLWVAFKCVCLFCCSSASRCELFAFYDGRKDRESAYDTGYFYHIIWIVCVCVCMYVCVCVCCYSYVSYIYVYRLLGDIVLVHTVGLLSSVNEYDAYVLTDISSIFGHPDMI